MQEEYNEVERCEQTNIDDTRRQELLDLAEAKEIKYSVVYIKKNICSDARENLRKVSKISYERPTKWLPIFS